MKKLAAFFLTAALMLALCACSAEPSDTAQETAGQAEKAECGEVTVLYTSDVHCGAEQGVGYNGIAAIKQMLTKTGHEVLLVDSGDFVQGELIGTLSGGEAAIELMNALGYDAVTLGNHEFDYGMEQFWHLAELADFPIISANFVNDAGELMLEPYKILERSGWKIAFVGASTPKTIVTSTPSNFMNEAGEFVYGFSQDMTGAAFYQAVQTAVDCAKADGADFVIVLSHLGIQAEAAPWTSSDLITNTTGIDVVLDGHSHTVMEKELVTNAAGEKVLLTSTGTKLENVGCLTIHADGTMETVLLDSSFRDVLDAELAAAEEAANAVVGHTDVELCITDPATGLRMVRQNETNLGDFCADAIRTVMGTDIAITNAGNIRADIAPGDITYGGLVAVSPFGNEIGIAEVTGQELLDALELSVSSLPGERGGFLQVSGIAFTVDVSVPSPVVFDENDMFVRIDGARRVKNVTVGEEPLDPERVYTMASSLYILRESGDGYSLFADNPMLVEGGKLDNQVLIEYISDSLGGNISDAYADPYGEDRITILDAE